jgi:hypothetical protein
MVSAVRSTYFKEDNCAQWGILKIIFEARGADSGFLGNLRKK